jgi:hypothetical protein
LAETSWAAAFSGSKTSSKCAKTAALGGDTSWQQFLDKNGEGIQHIAFQVDDVEKTVKAFGDAGMPVLHQGRYDDDSGSYTYIDSAKALGVTLELLHSEPKK